jgi:hypothetical protein
LGKRRKFCRSHPSNENCLVPGRDGAWLSHAPDLGATITGPRADLNLGITTYVNGAPMNPVQLDTSIVATDTIAYVAADQNGLTSTSTRTVLVEAAPSIVPRPTLNNHHDHSAMTVKSPTVEPSCVYAPLSPFGVRWSRLSEQIFRVDKWSPCRSYAAMRMGSGVK